MNRNKARGTRWESAIRDDLREHGIPAYRPAQGGAKDVGDLHGVSPFVIQAKDVERAGPTLIAEWIDAARRQAAHAGEAFGVVVWKRRRAATGLATVLLTLRDFVLVYRRLVRAESLLPPAERERAAHLAATDRARAITGKPLGPLLPADDEHE